MDDLTATALHSMIHRQFEAWNAQDNVMDGFKNRLLQGCTDEDSRDEVYAMMIINAMELAADISAKVILEILFVNRMMQPLDEDQIRKNMFSVCGDREARIPDAGASVAVKKG